MEGFTVSRNWRIPRTREQIDRDYRLTQKEISTESKYEKNIKNQCFLCHLWFNNTWKHYCTYGNSCKTCSGRVIRVNFSSKQNKTKLTREEATVFLEIRRLWVTKNHLDVCPSERPKGFVPDPCPCEDRPQKIEVEKIP